MKELSPAEQLSPKELIEMIDQISEKFIGQAPDLESAIGMLMVGRLFGWKVLYLVHSRRTINKYVEILGISDCQEFFPAETENSKRSMGYKIASKVSNFWKAVKGEYPGKDTRSPMLG